MVRQSPSAISLHTRFSANWQKSRSCIFLNIQFSVLIFTGKEKKKQ